MKKEDLEAALAKFDAQAEAAGSCLDGYCAVKRPKGQHTNGGCRCWQDKFKAQRMMRAGQALADAVRAALTRESPETIIAAACMLGNLTISLPPSKRHGDIMRGIGAYFDYIIGPEEQGFLTATGRFVKRIEAADIALAAKQIKRLSYPPQLYSEDLW